MLFYAVFATENTSVIFTLNTELQTYKFIEWGL